MARWEEALDALTDVYRYWRSDSGRRMAEKIEQDDGDSDSILFRSNAADEIFGDMAFDSDPIYIDPDMWKLVLAAAENWPGEGLSATDLPTEAGFMLLPEPYMETDPNGSHVSIRAINWYPWKWNDDNGVRRPGILLAYYHNINDPDDYTPRDRRGLPVWALSHAMPWIFDVNEADGPKYAAFAMGMTLQVCWRLMQQEVSISTPRVATGAFGKRALRAKLPQKHVTVVTLRRRQPDDEYASTHLVEWTHQWITSGHWRKQWYPSLSAHRTIWISPYVKGPPDKPLVINKVRAFQWTR
jgi:hypothetical protein